jgi:hypothetical protein
MMIERNDENLFPVWREPRTFWERTGLSERQQRSLDLSLVALLIIFTAGWIYAAAVAIERGDSPAVARRIGVTPSPLASTAPPSATFALNALLERFIDWEEVRGASGAVQIVLREAGDTLTLPDALPAEAAIAYVSAEDGEAETTTAAGPPERPGVWNLFLRMSGAVRAIPGVTVATLVPSTALRAGRIGEYRIGEWPRGEGAYAPPNGFVEVTPQNMNTAVSEHFQLKDFLTKGQEGVWPKYVVLSARLLDKLELTLQELELMGHPVENVFVVSGFRTPWYNETGGTTQGRGALSRHMYGDAADIAIDNDSSGCMDDLNGDGRTDVTDARIIVEAAERVERKHPNLIGGIGVYAPVRGSHCGMVHIDTRGNRARW